jgi:hypothetical protein
MLASDQSHWVKPIYAGLRECPEFGSWPAALQFAVLVEAIALEDPSQAAQLRQLSDDERAVLMLHLSSCYAIGDASGSEVSCRVRQRDLKSS